MTGLRSALASLRLEVAALPTRQALPPEARRPTFIALNRILRGRDIQPAAPAPDWLDEAWQRLQDCVSRGGTPAELPPPVLGRLTWLLWERARRACEVPGVLAAVQALARDRPRYLKRFIEAWLRDYRPEDEVMRRAGAWLADAVMRAPKAALAVWQAAERRHALFSSPEGPDSVARAVLHGGESDPLAELGFDTPARGTGGTMRAVLEQTAVLLPTSLSRPAGAQVLERAMGMFLLKGELRFDEPGMRGRMADALVGAWINGAPPDALRDRVLDILLTHIGDPRTQRVRWEQVSERTKRIVAGWLARVTITAFFGVIGRYAGAAGMGHHWVSRRKFWSACLEKGWISDAWLALGPNVFQDVKRNHALIGSYGRLEEATDSNHSALLMRIGSTVFVEWSHNGRLYAWEAGSGGGAPPFYSGRYFVVSLKSGALGFPPPSDRPDLPHLFGPGLTHHAETWRGRVATLLRQREGLRIEPREWA